MRKYLKYDAKSNMKFFLSSFVCFLILLVSLLSVRTVGSFSSLVRINSALNSIEIILIGVFLMTMLYFIINTFYRDLYTPRSILTFSLPISAKDFIAAKLLIINIFFFLLIFLSIVLFYLMGKVMDIRSLIAILFMVVLVNILSLLIFLYMQMDRFLFKRKNAIILTIILIVLIFVGGFFLNKEFLLLHNGNLIKNTDHILAFVMPYIKIEGINFLNLTAFVYYGLIFIILYIVNVTILKKDLDLS